MATMCIHAAIKELEEGAAIRLSTQLKDFLVLNQNDENFQIEAVIKGNPQCYNGMFYEQLVNRSSILLQNGEMQNNMDFDKDEPALLIANHVLMLYLP